MNQENETLIELSKVKLVLLVIGAFLFVAVGIWMLGLEDKEIASSTRYDDALFLTGLAWTAIGFFGLCALIGIRKLFDQRPGLILSDKGIVDNSSGISAGVIPWEDVSGITQYQLQSQTFVSILVSDPEKYVLKGGLMKQLANRANMKMCGTPLNISSNSLKISHDELFELMSEYYQKYGNKTQL